MWIETATKVDFSNPVWFLAFVAVAAVYLAPTIVAIVRGSRNSGPVLLVNVLLGWTVIGWIVSLTMALRGR